MREHASRRDMARVRRKNGELSFGIRQLHDRGGLFEGAYCGWSLLFPEEITVRVIIFKYQLFHRFDVICVNIFFYSGLYLMPVL